MTKFDSVSTLLADYTGRKIAAAAGNNGEAAGAAIAPSSTKTRRRAATAAPAGGGTSVRTSKKRSRTNAASGVIEGNLDVGGSGGATTSRVNVDSNAPYPTGKLEEDKSPSLFASSTGGGGRKMVSLMAGGGKKGGGGGGGSGIKRRAKTAGMVTKGQQVGERGTSLKGLAIRDLTPPGFLPAATATATAGDDAANAAGGGGNIVASASTAQNSDNTGGTAVAGAEKNAQAVGESKIAGKNDTADQVGGGASADADATVEPDVQKVKEVCFNCWSKGSGKTCTLHSGGVAGKDGGGTGGGKADGQARMAESVLMCKNWDVGVMRRRYRSEELQVSICTTQREN